MSYVSEVFLRALGPASPPARPGLQFGGPFDQLSWETLHEEIGAGFFLDGFLYLFGEGLEPLLACLPPWSFLVPPLPRPMIVGYNAFGTLLVVKDSAGPTVRLGVLDPARVVWWEPPDLDFTGLIGTWIPDRRIPHFLDHAPYEAWRAAGGRRLALGEMLSMKMPAALGGQLVPENFEITDIIRYYQASGPVYEKTVAKAGVDHDEAPRAPTETRPPAPKKKKKK
jgi:hypothetical protein